ncbi:MAG TPA: hypothetical protein VHD90_05205 [Phototrophicaceae bacterium]|nr:hypothetical protein [Phototrophicaceae bacterium]
MLNWDVHSLEQIHDEWIERAEQEHLAQEVIDEERKSNPHYNPTLAWFGHRVMDFGQKIIQMSGSEDDKLHLN